MARRKRRKGLLGGLIDIIGYASIVLVLVTSFMDASREQGGAIGLVNQTIDNPQIREDVASLQLASIFLTPVLQFGDALVSIDALTIFSVLLISLSIIWLISWLLKPGVPYLIVIFIIVFAIVATAWQAFWLDKYLESGQALGIPRDTLLSNLRQSSQFVSSTPLLVLNIIASVFLFSKLYHILPFT